MTNAPFAVSIVGTILFLSGPTAVMAQASGTTSDRAGPTTQVISRGEDGAMDKPSAPGRIASGCTRPVKMVYTGYGEPYLARCGVA